MKIISPAFDPGKSIPTQYTCDGANISVPLKWHDVTGETKSLALIMDDPDAPMGTWVHWVVYNIPPSMSGFSENQPKTENLPDSSKQGINSSHKTGYGGPCPPSGIHRYFFKLYALDCMLEESGQRTKKDLLDNMEGHVLEKSEMHGIYQRK